MKRQIIDINKDWYFSLGDNNKYEIVTLPHCVKLTPYISSGNRNYQGICNYYKNLYIPLDFADKNLTIEFEGAMGVTELYVNNQLIKTSYCSYIPLVADITSYVKYGENNIISLKLDNSDNEEVPPGKPQGSLDFTYEGGLYRKATLTVTNKIQITHPLLENEIAGGGVFVWFEDVLQPICNVVIKTHIKNSNKNKKNIIVEYYIKDDDEIVNSISTNLSIEDKVYSQVKLQVKNPKLWDIFTPNLYKLEIKIYENKQLIDDYSLDIGIRTFKYTSDKGILFNGKYKKIQGGNYHHTYPYIGNALPDSLMERDLIKLARINTQNIRSHYPFPKVFTDLCNQMGITLIVSAPGWQWFKDGIFLERAYKNVRDMVRWQRNNPCVILWEPILNESMMTYEFQENVHNIVHEEYPYSDCYTASDHGPTDVSYSLYDPGMLQPETITTFTKKIEEKKFEKIKPVWVREYGDSPDNWDDHNCSWRTYRGLGDYAMVRAVERMMGLDPQNQNYHYMNCLNKPEISGFGIWPAIEHNRGYHVNPCYGGYLDMFRLPKFTYHFMESEQDVDKAGVKLFIANYWSEISPSDVTVYSNAQKVRLYHDEILVGEEKPIDCSVKHPPFVFKNVRQYKRRARATLKAQAIIDGEIVAETMITSPGTPKKLKLKIDTEGIPPKADGNDILLVHCHIQDNLNQTVPFMGDRHPILFEIEGEGSIIGDSDIGANPICADAGIATVMIRTTHKKGDIKLSARMLWEQYGDAKIVGDEITITTI